MFLVGIDIGKDNHIASIMSENDKVVFKAFSSPNSSDGGNALFAKFASYSSSTANFEIGMETTGHYRFSVCSFLFEKKSLLYVINPTQADGRQKDTEIRKRKNNIIDFVLFVDLIRYEPFVETKRADEDLFSLHTLTHFHIY